MPAQYAEPLPMNMISKVLLDHLPMRYFYKDRSCMYLYVNTLYADDLHTSPDAAVGKTDFDFYPRPLAEKYRADDERIMDTGIAQTYEERYHVEGEQRWIEIMKIPIKDQSDDTIGIVGIFRDITTQKMIEQALQQANLYNRSLLEANLDPLVTIGPDGTITDVNNASVEATGVPREQLIGSDFSNYFTEPERAKAGYQSVYRDGYVRDYPLDIRHCDGRITPVLYNASLYRDADGKVIGVFAAARDITDRKKAEEISARQMTQIAIAKQAQEILEISTPVLQVWDGVVVAPLIGTLDSQRTQQFMERLLHAIVNANASVAIVDITGVPTIDTQTAQHLIDTINAVQLLGARLMLTGVRPAIAQAVVHLGIDLTGVATRPSLMSGLQAVIETVGSAKL